MAIPEVIDGTLRQREVPVQALVTVREVEEEAYATLSGYVSEHLRQHDADPEVLRQLDQRALRITNLEMARILRSYADDLNTNPAFQRWIEANLTVDWSMEMFMRVAEEMFSDGVFNYGRVAALFCFTMMVCLKAVQRRLSVNRILELINWTMCFFRDRVAPWIVGRGGWNILAAGNGDVVDGAARMSSVAATAISVTVKVSIVLIVGFFVYKAIGGRL